MGKIELYEDKYDELLGRTPSWLVNWGMVMIFLFVCMLFLGSNFFKYPATVSSSITITTENPPTSIIALNNGKIDQLFVQNGQLVKAGEYLAIMDNTSNYMNVLELKRDLKKLKKIILEEDYSKMIYIPDDYILGSIQPSYSNFQRLYNDFKKYFSISIIEKKIISIGLQIKDYEQYFKKLNFQVVDQKIAVQLYKNQYVRDSVLLETCTVTVTDYEKSKQAFLQGRSGFYGLEAAQENVKMQINQLNYQIVNLQNQRLGEIENMINELRESYDNLVWSILEWEKKYVLISPINGIITFNKYWNANQFVVSNEIVFSVIPSEKQQIVGRMKFPVNGSGKVKINQKVQIRLANFPYVEYGMIEGKIETISLIPELVQDEYFYTAEVSLTYGLTTNYKKTLPFNQQMQGTAEIITEDMTIYQRLINPIKSTLTKSK